MLNPKILLLSAVLVSSALVFSRAEAQVDQCGASAAVLNFDRFDSFYI